MTRISRLRVALLAGALVVAFGSLSTRAPAALDMNVGAAKVVQSQPVSACNNAAKSALNTVLQNAVELGGDTGEWLAFAAPDSANGSTAAAAIIAILLLAPTSRPLRVRLRCLPVWIVPRHFARNWRRRLTQERDSFER